MDLSLEIHNIERINALNINHYKKPETRFYGVCKRRSLVEHCLVLSL